MAGLSGGPGAPREACLLPSAEGVLSPMLYSDAQENISFPPFEQNLEGVVWLYSGFSFRSNIIKMSGGFQMTPGFLKLNMASVF